MDKTVAGILGAMAGLAAAGSAHAAVGAAPRMDAGMGAAPASYAELLAPIPDAVAALKADDAARAQATPEAPVELAQYYGPPRGYDHHHHHYHHHHHRYYSRRHYHHHHHHHHGVVVGIPGVGGVVVR